MHRVGTAGWSLPIKPKASGSHLYHYARTLGCVEINSSFHRAHRAGTWARWAAETPAEFRFSIKAPRAITHEAKLRNTKTLLKDFLEQIEPIHEKAGPILFQLPPSLAFDPALAKGFFGELRSIYQKDAVLEPRHATWFTQPVDDLLQSYMIARVAADPAKGAIEAAEPGGTRSLDYYRLHGTPRVYYSSYEDQFLTALAAKIQPLNNAWVIFDNTALASAYSNAIRLQKLLADCG